MHFVDFLYHCSDSYLYLGDGVGVALLQSYSSKYFCMVEAEELLQIIVRVCGLEIELSIFTL